jgi:hypothetical protein
MHSRLPVGLIALAAGLSALILSGCGSTAATIDPVAEAALATTHAGGAQMSMHISMDIEGLANPITVAGTGDMNFTDGEAEVVSNLSGLPTGALSSAPAGSLSFTELYAKGALFMQSPLFSGKLPGGAGWIKVDLLEAAQGIGLDPQSLSSGQSNPAQFLAYLKAGGGQVTKVADEAVRGVRTTRYRATIDPAKAIEKAAASGHALSKESVKRLVAQAGLKTIPVEVWVDAHNLVRRLAMTISEAPQGHHVNLSIGLELFDFGATPSVNPPSGGEVYDVTPSALSALAAAG